MNKGTTNNPAGRPVGKPNKVTAELRDRIKLFLEKSWSIVQKDFKELEPKDRIAIYEKMLKYVVPVQKETAIDLNIEKMTEKDLDIVIDHLINNSK